MQVNRYKQKSVLEATAKFLRGAFIAMALCLPMRSTGVTLDEAPKRRVICMGEAVLDILFRGNQPISANAGGSALNSAVSMGRAGLNVVFIGEVGADTTGAHIRAFLEANHVDVQYLRLRPGIKTTVSTAYLDETNNARYTFYPDPRPNDQESALPDIRPDDIVLFGSFYAANPANSGRVNRLLQQARQVGAIVCYDINIRTPHADMLDMLRPRIRENMAQADIVRSSTGDLRVVFGRNDVAAAYTEEVAPRCLNFVCTDGPRPVSLYARGDVTATYPVKKIETVSTIGAGDNFNAGLIYGLVRLNITRRQLSEGLPRSMWDKLIDYAGRFSQNCCQHLENYVSEDFGRDICR